MQMGSKVFEMEMLLQEADALCHSPFSGDSQRLTSNLLCMCIYTVYAFVCVAIAAVPL